MSDVFISYKAEDRRRVKPLVEALQAEGYSVWWDEQIEGGSAWRQTIETELNAARCVIVAWSKRSVGPEGTFVQDEATRAQQRRVYVPVLLDKVHLPLGFGEMQALPLTGWKGDRADPRYRAVLEVVQRKARAEPVPSPLPDRGSRVDRRAVIGGAAVAAAAVAGGGGWLLLKGGRGSKSDSIAVLPFANLSGDPAQSYFSDGIAEELRSALARLAGLKVVGRTSSEAVRDDDAETAARKLGVSNILTGSVRQSPSTIRISAQLIDGKDGLERWSQHYDRAPGDAIKIQTDIAENVARSLSNALGASALRAITVGGTNNPQAQRLLLQAVEATQRGDKEGLQRGILLADAAIRADPKYADAYAAKALFQNWYASTYSSDAAELFKMRGEAKATAQHALELAPTLASGHRAIAEIHRVLLEIPPAVKQYKRAIELAPGDSGAISDYSFLLGSLGKAAEAIRLSDQAIALDPLNSRSYLSRFMALLAARRFDEATRFAQQLERTRPHLFDWPESLAYALIVQNRLSEAETYVRRSPPDHYNRLVNEAVILSRTGKAAQVPAIIARMRQLYADAASYQYGQVYAQTGDADRALAALNRGWEIRDAGLLRLKTDPYLDPVRSDPRFGQLLRKVNFPN